MFDYKVAQETLKALHEAALVQPGYYKDQVSGFIEAGEYGLTLDTIAGAFLDNKARMPPDLFVMFENLVNEMKLDRDPEYIEVAEFRKFQQVGNLKS